MSMVSTDESEFGAVPAEATDVVHGAVIMQAQMSMSMMATAESEFGKLSTEAIVEPSDAALGTTAPAVTPTDVVHEETKTLYFIPGMVSTNTLATTSTTTAATVSTTQGAKAGKAEEDTNFEFDNVEEAFLDAEGPPAEQTSKSSKGSKRRGRTLRNNAEVPSGRNLQAEESMSLSVEEEYFEAAAIADSAPDAGSKGGKRGRRMTQLENRRSMQAEESMSLSIEEEYFEAAAIADSAPFAGSKGGKRGRRLTRLVNMRNMQVEESMSMSKGTGTGNLRMFEWVDDGTSLSMQMQMINDGNSLSMKTEAIVITDVPDLEVTIEPNEAAKPIIEATTAATTAATTTAATTTAATTSKTKAGKEEPRVPAAVSWVAEPLNTATSQQWVLLQSEGASSEDGTGGTIQWASKASKGRKV